LLLPDSFVFAVIKSTRDDNMDSRVEYHLKQYTPFIALSPEEAGATLRATEAKPKLDRFIVSQLGANGIRSYHAQWILRNEDDENGVIALNYKMRFNAIGKAVKSDYSDKEYY
jgi:hypothetical protein